ncbi:MAG: hypothetical protein ACYDG6_08630 [Thermincolia bacterium]
MTRHRLIKVAAVTSGKKVPSTRFRVRQHVEPLRLAGIEVHEYVPAIDKYPPLPGWPGERFFHRTLCKFWQGAKLVSRVPGVVGSWKADIT